MDAYLSAGKYIASMLPASKGELDAAIESADNEFARFQNKYAPADLRATQKSDIYDRYFKLESESMIYEMRRRGSAPIQSHLGHLSQWANNFPFYAKSGSIIIGRGMPMADKAVSRAQACEIGQQLIWGLANCADYVAAHDLNSLDDYHAFESFASKQLGSQMSRDWVHKYLSLIFPEQFTEFQGNDYRQKALKVLGVAPDASVFGTDWQFNQIQSHSGIAHPYAFAHAVYSIPEVRQAILNKTLHSVVPKKPVTPGVFGQWEIFSLKSVGLKPEFDENETVDIPIPEEVEFFFHADGLPESRTIHFEIGGLTYDAELSYAEDGGFLSFDSETCALLTGFCHEHDCDVALGMTCAGKNVYACQLFKMPLPDPVVPEDETEQQLQAESLSEKRLYRLAQKRGTQAPEAKTVSTIQRHRDPYIAEYAKRRAGGICQLCHEAAPFCDQNSKPYLESHHIVFLSEGGADSIENTVALCPNCHRRVHVLKDPKDTQALLQANQDTEKP